MAQRIFVSGCQRASSSTDWSPTSSGRTSGGSPAWVPPGCGGRSRVLGYAILNFLFFLAVALPRGAAEARTLAGVGSVNRHGSAAWRRTMGRGRAEIQLASRRTSGCRLRDGQSVPGPNHAVRPPRTQRQLLDYASSPGRWHHESCCPSRAGADRPARRIVAAESSPCRVLLDARSLRGRIRWRYRVGEQAERDHPRVGVVDLPTVAEYYSETEVASACDSAVRAVRVRLPFTERRPSLNGALSSTMPKQTLQHTKPLVVQEIQSLSCRQPQEHVRGCWLVDLLLGKK